MKKKQGNDENLTGNPGLPLKPVYILGLDTTSKYSSIAVSKNGDILGDYSFTSFNNLSASLIPTIAYLLVNTGLTLADIDIFGAAVGPGLFTGIRIGLSTLKGLVFGAEKRLLPVITLEALAYQYYETNPGSEGSAKIVMPLIDAKRDEVYLAAYRVSRQEPGLTGLTGLLAPRLLNVNRLDSEIIALAAAFQVSIDEIIFLGSGAVIHREILTTAFRKEQIFFRSAFLAQEVCKITYHRYQAGDSSLTTDLQKLQPLYIRKPDAEQNLK